MRFENFTANSGMARVMQEIPVQPNRCYRASAWVKTDAVAPATGDWRKITVGFNSQGYSRIRLSANSRIPDGEPLRVSYHHAVSINSGQVGVCMSEPRVHDIIATNAALLWRVFAPRRWMLSVDEIRAGGSDLSCRSRGLSMAQILGDFITRAMAAIRHVNPDAEVFAWSDMLDPNHNAHGDYYLVDGDYTGSWQYIPADLRIVCWYYDLSNPRGWLDALRATPGAMGIMYTTWQNKYALLADFGDLVSAGP
jgi:hypothetical protein